jgi:hypothetical protein
MSQINGTRAARYRSAIVAGAIAVILLCGGRGSAWAASNGTPAAPAGASANESSSTRATTPATPTAPTLADSYADRETSARNLENFKGGDVVIVGSTGLIVVLLLVIILLSL